MTNLVVLPSELLKAPAHIPCLIDGIIPQKSLVGLVAQSGAGKSLLAIDMCAHMALVMPWRGRAAGARGVLYVVGEGFTGLGGRVRAWCAEHEIDAERLDKRLAFLRVPWDISDTEMIERVLGELRDLSFEVECIVLDTVSSNAAPGFDENNTAHMKLFLDAGRALRDRLETTVFLIHHAGHNAERERGSSDFRAALDVMLFLRNDDGVRSLTMSKGRDHEPFLPIRFRLKGAHGSAVICYDEVEAEGAFTPSMRAALAVLRDEGQGEPMRVKDWQVRAEGRVQRSQFYQIRRRLEEGGYIATDAKRGIVLTRRGEEAIEIEGEKSGQVRPDRNPSIGPSPVRPPYTGGAGTGPRKQSDWTGSQVRSDLRQEGPGLLPVDWSSFEQRAPP